MSSRNKTWTNNGINDDDNAKDRDTAREDPLLPGNKWKHLQGLRESERAAAIAAKLMPDPNVRYRLDEAITMKGTCEDMCPELERHEREAKSLLDPWEYEGGPTSTAKPKRISHEHAVKCYQRGSGDTVLPSDLRTPEACLKTTSYLFHLLQDHGLPATHAFVRDRTRAVRLDLRVQMIEDGLCSQVTGRCARFHILSLHALRQLPKDKFDFGTEAEQIGQNLQTLKQLPAPHALIDPPHTEFMAYYILFHIRNEPPPPRHESEPGTAQKPAKRSRVVEFARGFREEVKRSSPAFAKRSKLEVSSGCIDLFNTFTAAFLSPPSGDEYLEDSLDVRYRRSVLFLVSSLLEFHFGEGCVAGMDSIEKRGGMKDVEIIECDQYLNGGDSNSSTISSGVKLNPLAPAFALPSSSAPNPTSTTNPFDNFAKVSNTSSKTLPSTTPFGSPAPNTFASANTFSPPRNGLPSSTPAANAFGLGSGSNPFGTSNAAATPTLFSSTPSNNGGNAFGLSSVPASNPFGSSSTTSSNAFGIHSSSSAPKADPFASTVLAAPKPSAFSGSSAFGASPSPSPSPSPFGVGNPESQPLKRQSAFPSGGAAGSNSFSGGSAAASEQIAPSTEKQGGSGGLPFQLTPSSRSGTNSTPFQQLSFPPLPPSLASTSQPPLFPPPPTFPPLTSSPLFPPMPTSTPPSLASTAPTAEKVPVPFPIPPPTSTSTSTSLFPPSHSILAPPSNMADRPKPPTRPSFPPSGQFAPSVPSKLKTSIVPSPSPSASSSVESSPMVRAPALQEKENSTALGAEQVYDKMLRSLVATICSETLASEFANRVTRNRTRGTFSRWYRQAASRRNRKVEKRENELKRAEEWKRGGSSKGWKRERVGSMAVDVAEDGKRRRMGGEAIVNGSAAAAVGMGAGEIGDAVKQRAERRQRYWEAGTFLSLVRTRVHNLIASRKGDGIPQDYAILLSTNTRYAQSAIWLRTKFGLPPVDVASDGDRALKKSVMIPLSASRKTEDSWPGLVVFECTPLDRGLGLDERSKILQRDCERLVGVWNSIEGMEGRSYECCLLVICWIPDGEVAEEIALPISATIQSLAIQEAVCATAPIGSPNVSDPHETFGSSLAQLPLDVSGRMVRVLTVDELIRLLLKPWDELAQNGISLCRGADDFNWPLTGYVLSAALSLLNKIVGITDAIIEESSKGGARFEMRRLPRLGTMGFDDSRSSLQAMLAYLEQDSFEGDASAYALAESLREDGGRMESEYTGTAPATFMRGLSQILLEDVSLSGSIEGQSLRLRVVRTRVEKAETGLRTEVQRTLSDLKVLRSSTAKVYWKRSGKENADAVNGDVAGWGSSHARSVSAPSASGQEPLTLDDLRRLPSETPRQVGFKVPPPSKVTAAMSAGSSSQTQLSASQTAGATGLRTKAQEILAKYGRRSLSSSSADVSMDLDTPIAQTPELAAISPSGHPLPRPSPKRQATLAASPVPLKIQKQLHKKPSFTDLLQKQTEEVLGSSVQTWGNGSTS